MHRLPRRTGALLALTALAALPLGLPVAAAAVTADPIGLSAEEVAGSDAARASAEERRDRDEPRSRAARVKPGTARGAKVAKLGWWSRSNEQLPETGLAAPPSVPAVGAPKGSYPVAQIRGEAERIIAIELDVNGEPGSTVTSVRLSIRESGDPTGSPNAASAAIVACPMTEVYWSEIENGPWGTKPTYDCSLGAAPGARDDTGVWTFDLTSLASDWLSEDREFAPAVVLVGSPGDGTADGAVAPEPGASSFQVAFDAAKGLGVVARSAPGSDEAADPDDDPDDDPGATDGSGAVAAGGSGSGGGLGSGGLGGGGLDASGGDLGPAPGAGDPVALDDAAAAEDGVEAAAAPASPTLAPVSSGPLPWHAGLGGRLLLLIPALLLGYLVMVAMGPNAQPVVGGGRRGVSRALDKVAAATPLRFGRKSS